MRRFLSISFITLSLIIGTAGAAPAAHAAVGDACDVETDTCSTSAGGNTGDYCSFYTNKCVPNSQMPAEVAKADKAAAGTPTAFEGSPQMEGFFATVMHMILSLFAWLLTAAMITLNYAVYYTVVTMGEYVKNLSAIGVTWRILRDVANIMLIFGFIGAGIATILNVDQYGWKTKMLPMLLVGAVFLNFSLFITEAMIDGTNLFATQFYTQINGGDMPTKDTLLNEGISGKIMQQLGLQTIYGEVRGKPEVLKASNSLFVAFMGIILFIVTAFVMFSLAFILIARFVALIFFIILSPVGFMGLAIPQMQYRAGQWWKNFLEQIITAPVLLLLLYVALAVITDAQFLAFGGSPDWIGLVPGSTNFAGYAGALLSFLVAMGLLLVVVIKAKSMSAFGAAGAIKLGGKLSFGATAWAGRATIGTGIGRVVLGNRWIKKAAVSDNALVKYGSRLASFTGKRLQNRTFDLRNMPGAKTGLSALTIDAGTPSELTAKDLQEKKYGWKPVTEFFRQSDIEHEQAAEELKRKAALAGTNNDEITRALAKMTTKEIEELGGIKSGVEKLVNNLSPQQFEALMKSDKLSEVEKGRIKTTRYKPLNDAVVGGSATDIKKVLGNMSKSELESMPPELLATSEILDNLSDKQRDTLTDGKERTAGEKKLIKGASKVGKLEEVFNTVGAGAASALVAGLNKQQAAKLDRNVLVHPAISAVLTPDMLRAILREDKLIPADLATIKTNVLAGGLLSSQDYLNTGPDRTLWP